MTRVLLSLLAVVEAALGMFGLLNTINLFLSHGAGMTAIFLPVLAVTVLLLVAGAAIFVRKPWSLWVHIVAVVLAGVLSVLYLAPLVGTDPIVALFTVGIIVALLTILFFLPPVQRYFAATTVHAPKAA